MRALVPADELVAEGLDGLVVVDVQWSLTQVNKLLFIRELHRTGRIGEDGVTPPLH